MQELVETGSGRVAGTPGEISIFKGIPFAAPPIGELRWRPPAPVKPWPGVRPALEAGPDPMQVPLPMSAARTRPMSEDCLTLNIWTPASRGGENLPVMVWIPGGSFVAGSGADPMCDGENLARKDVVLVTINYRVGLFGFVAHPALTAESEHRASGNYGLLDQIAALQWIRDNIGAFGGNPNRVTAIGVSAGSASISLLMTSPLGRALFHQAILESPGSFRPLADLEEASRAGQMLGNDLTAMRALSADDILNRTSQFVPRVRGLTTPRVLRPIRDGWVIDRQERDAYLAGRFAAVPMVVGSNFDEGGLFVGAWPVKTVRDFHDLVALNFGTSSEQALKEYPVGSDYDVVQQCAFLFGDTQFTYGARGIARANSALLSATYRYLFTRHRCDGPQPPKHGDEVPYIFGRLAAAGMAPLPTNARDRALSETMMNAWVRFAATGDPNGGNLPNWQGYDGARDNYFELGNELKAGSAWRLTQMAFLDSFFDARSAAS
jgi:carboxylesterase type B